MLIPERLQLGPAHWNSTRTTPALSHPTQAFNALSRTLSSSALNLFPFQDVWPDFTLNPGPDRALPRRTGAGSIKRDEPDWNVVNRDWCSSNWTCK